MAADSVARGRGPHQAHGARGAETAAGGGKGGASSRRADEAAWEAASYAEGCAYARERALGRLAALEEGLHAARLAGYAVEGWRTRTLATRMGDLRVRRRLYRAPDGTGHFLLDEHLGWPARQAATPEYAALLADFATDLPYAEAARKLAAATAGTLAGDTTRRLLKRMTARVGASEVAAHAACVAAGIGPEPARTDVPAVLYAEADGVWVPTQREPAHPNGLELKCASAYEGWEQVGRATPGHPRPHYRLVAKQVYCHVHDQRALPFWEGASLHLAHTYDLSRLPLVVVGGDGAHWIDTATDVFWRTVRQRDGFHLARDAARGWGTDTGAQLYEVLRRGDQPTTIELLALPPPTGAVPAGAPLALPPPSTPPTNGSATVAEGTPGGTPGNACPPGPLVPSARARRARWSRRQVERARAALLAQVATDQGTTDWRHQVAPHEVPAGARGLGTQEGTNAHLLARRMKRRGCSWSVAGARAMAKARELVTNGTLAPWCLRPLPAPRRASHHVAGTSPSRLPWPAVAVPAAHGPTRDAAVAHLQRVLAGGFRH